MENPFAQINERLNKRRFTVADNAQRLSVQALYFLPCRGEDAISGTYQGGRIHIGHQVGRITGPDTIELLFQCLTTQGNACRLVAWQGGR